MVFCSFFLIFFLERKSSVVVITIFFFVDLVALFMKGEYYAQCGGVPVFINEMAPDITLSNVPIIPDEIITEKVKKNFFK